MLPCRQYIHVANIHPSANLRVTPACWRVSHQPSTWQLLMPCRCGEDDSFSFWKNSRWKSLDILIMKKRNLILELEAFCVKFFTSKQQRRLDWNSRDPGEGLLTIHNNSVQLGGGPAHILLAHVGTVWLLLGGFMIACPRSVRKHSRRSAFNCTSSPAACTSCTSSLKSNSYALWLLFYSAAALHAPQPSRLHGWPNPRWRSITLTLQLSALPCRSV